MLRFGIAAFGGGLLARQALGRPLGQPIAAESVQPGHLGVFDSQGDVGVTPRAGSVQFDPGSGVYRVWGGGANIWTRVDAFHFVWRRMSGDMTLEATVRWAQPLPTTDRKAGVMIRQNLDPGAAYADGVVHGRALTAFQYRETRGALTESVRLAAGAPVTLRLERRGHMFRLWAAPAGQPLKALGAARITLRDPVYAGLAVCAHNAADLEEAIFSEVRIRSAPTRKREMG
ncbi:MAG: hypothetical protein ACRD1N_07025 [Terriglobia bacterium]